MNEVRMAKPEAPHPIEKEVKILNVDPEDVRAKFKAIGVVPNFDGTIENIRIDSPDGALKVMGLRPRVRARTENGKTTYEWTIKKDMESGADGEKQAPEDDSKKRRLSFTSEQDAFESLKSILFSAEYKVPIDTPLGVIRRVLKRRVSYAYQTEGWQTAAAVDVDSLITIDGKDTFRGQRISDKKPWLEIEDDSPRHRAECAKFLGLTIDTDVSDLSEAELIDQLFPKEKS